MRTKRKLHTMRECYFCGEDIVDDPKPREVQEGFLHNDCYEFLQEDGAFKDRWPE